MRHVPALKNAHSRAWNNLQAVWRLAPASTAPATWASLAALQQASIQKLLQQQNAWINDWRDWWNTAQQLPRANTVSKLLEQEFDLALRVVQILGNQAVNWANLQENLEVNYGHWASQQAKAAEGQ
jgi:plasmid maintenance system antidote protein VapI